MSNTENNERELIHDNQEIDFIVQCEIDIMYTYIISHAEVKKDAL